MSGFVSVEMDGKVYEAEYHEVGGVITVYGDMGDSDKTEAESTSVGGMQPDYIAKILLRRLVKRGVISPEDGQD